jgi:hypothetical protein
VPSVRVFFFSEKRIGNVRRHSAMIIASVRVARYERIENKRTKSYCNQHFSIRSTAFRTRSDIPLIKNKAFNEGRQFGFFSYSEKRIGNVRRHSAMIMASVRVARYERIENKRAKSFCFQHFSILSLRSNSIDIQLGDKTIALSHYLLDHRLLIPFLFRYRGAILEIINSSEISFLLRI